jgi:hypothetical protein
MGLNDAAVLIVHASTHTIVLLACKAFIETAPTRVRAVGTGDA